MRGLDFGIVLTKIKGLAAAGPYFAADEFHKGLANMSNIGHNSHGVEISVQVRLFNSVGGYNPEKSGWPVVTLPAGGNIGDVARQLGVPKEKIFVALVNGKDVTPGLIGNDIRTSYELEDGDVVAFSGPVPYSYGYGAPVV